MLFSFCTTIAAPNSAHVFARFERGGRIEQGRGRERLIQTRHAKAHFGNSRPYSFPTCATTPNERQQQVIKPIADEDQNNAGQSRRDTLSSHRCRPPFLPRCSIHETIGLRRLGRGDSRLSISPLLLGYGIFTNYLCLSAQLTPPKKMFPTYPEMADPTKARLRPALRLGGVFGFIGGFLLAYQRSSREFCAWISSAHG